jgi:hypothetical protein
MTQQVLAGMGRRRRATEGKMKRILITTALALVRKRTQHASTFAGLFERFFSKDL